MIAGIALVASMAVNLAHGETFIGAFEDEFPSEHVSVESSSLSPLLPPKLGWVDWPTGGALMARRPGGARRSGPAAPSAG